MAGHSGLFRRPRHQLRFLLRPALQGRPDRFAATSLVSRHTYEPPGPLQFLREPSSPSNRQASGQAADRRRPEARFLTDYRDSLSPCV